MKPPDFCGSFPYHVDEKGRTKLPAPFLETLGSSFTATRGLDGCVWVLPPAAWETLSSQLATEGFGTRESRRLQRFFVGSAVSCALDAQGRLALPQVLREYAGIGSEIIVAGVGPWVEIWARARWEEETTTASAAEIDELLRRARLALAPN